MTKVLIIEEQAKIRKLLVNAFKKEGFETCDGIGWENAIEFAKENIYDLVIADMEVKPQVGCEMLKTIKLFNQKAEIVAIFHPKEYDVGRMISSGVYDYVLKPFLIKDVLNIGKKALEKKKLADKVRSLEQIMDMDKVVLQQKS